MSAWSAQELRRRLRRLYDPPIAPDVVELLVAACEGFRGVPSIYTSPDLREHRAAVSSLVDKLRAVEGAYLVLLGGERKGLRLPDAPPEWATLDLIRRDLQRLQDQAESWAAGGRKEERGITGLMRGLVKILSDNGVNKRRHGAVTLACFDAMGIGDKAKHHLGKVRKKQSAPSAGNPPAKRRGKPQT